MPNAQCPMPNAQCPNMHALRILLQVEACAELTATGERRFDSREFAFLVRYVCSEVGPAGELLRAFETFDPRGHNAVSADALVTQLINSGVPPEEIESVIRAAGPSAHGNIHYVRLVRALYPHSGGDADELLRETGSTRGELTLITRTRTRTRTRT